MISIHLNVVDSGSRSHDLSAMYPSPCAGAALRSLLSLLAGFCLVTGLLAADSSSTTATLSGTVGNRATGNLLEGATVEIPALNRSAITDSSGRFVLGGLPAGLHEIVVAYTGLDTVRETVTVNAGQRPTRDFKLMAEIYQLSEFRISGEREGNAAAITARRNAANVKNVVALDAYGNLPNMSAGELVVRLPGVTGQLDQEGNVVAVMIRGTDPGLNRVNVDGNLVSNVGGFGRNFQTHSLTGAMFEQVELVKGHLPDQSADSVGGSVNLKTRSPLSISERRRINYSFGARWAPSFFDQAPMREKHPIHPQLNLGYQEVFDVAGGSRNLGISLSTFYSENVNAPHFYSYDYQATTASPAFIWDYRSYSQYNNRKQSAVNLKAEYRLTENTKFILSGIYNDALEAFDRRYTARFFSNQIVATVVNGTPTGTGAILPGYTDRITDVRAVAGSNLQTTSVLNSFFNRTRMIGLGAEHRYARWEFDYDANFSRTHNNLAAGLNGPGGSLSATISTIGWRVDASDPENPVFTQTAGPSIYDIANYRTGVVLTKRNNSRDVDIYNAKANVLYRPELAVPMRLKSGVAFRSHEVGEVSGQVRWNYIGNQPLSPLTNDEMFDAVRTGKVIPFVETSALTSQLSNSQLWSEDIFNRETNRFSGTRNATEEITAGYLMADAKIRRLSVVAGVRGEHTEVSGFGYVRVAPATAAQIPDPVARARHDWDNPVTNNGSNTKWFPSVHFTYDVLPAVKARASWSTSFGRPSFGSLVPAAAISEAARTVRINNPSLEPQYAKNIDLSLEYYFKPAGMFSVGYFRKDIGDYIVTRDIGIVPIGVSNGFDGDYEGFTLQSQSNSGSAKISGFEFDYRQQLTFLPGPLQGFAVSTNFTLLSASGNYGGPRERSTSEIVDFVPESGNASLSYARGKFGANILLNYTGRYLDSFSDNASRLSFRASRTIVNAGVSYQFRPYLTFFCDLMNVFSEPQRLYRGGPSRPSQVLSNDPAMTFGVSGRF